MLTAYREIQLHRRHRRVRKKVSGTQERPRLAVHRSHLHLVAQLVDDSSGRTLLFCSTRDSEFRKSVPKGGTVEASRRLGELLAEAAQKAGFKKVVFDRGGHRYHGRVKAVADGARSKGLEM